MKYIKLENGMEITILPLPKNLSMFYYEYKGFYNNEYFYSDNSDLHNKILSIVFDNRHKLNVSIFRKYLIICLLNDQLVLTTIGHKIYEKIKESSPIMDHNFRFKKLKILTSDINIGFTNVLNYDKCYFSDNYYQIKYKNINEYISDLKDDDLNCIENFINTKSLTNEHNYNLLNKMFIDNKLGDIKTLIRTYKIEKVKNKCLN